MKIYAERKGHEVIVWFGFLLPLQIVQRPSRGTETKESDFQVSGTTEGWYNHFMAIPFLNQL